MMHSRRTKLSVAIVFACAATVGHLSLTFALSCARGQEFTRPSIEFRRIRGNYHAARPQKKCENGLVSRQCLTWNDIEEPSGVMAEETTPQTGQAEIHQLNAAIESGLHKASTIGLFGMAVAAGMHATPAEAALDVPSDRFKTAPTHVTKDWSDALKTNGLDAVPTSLLVSKPQKTPLFQDNDAFRRLSESNKKGQHLFSNIVPPVRGDKGYGGSFDLNTGKITNKNTGEVTKTSQ